MTLYMKKENISYLELGLRIGCALGVLFDNLATYLGVGLAIGAGLDSVKKKPK